MGAPSEFGETPNNSTYSNGVYGMGGSGSSGGGTVGNSDTDCPVQTTYSAGDYVWLESERNVVTLEKTVDSATGGIIAYEGQGLTMADYVEENLYDLHAINGIGEYLLEGVQPTVPKDWTWLYPDLWGNYTHDRTRDFEFGWTPAGTYPICTIFGFWISFAQRLGSHDRRPCRLGWAYPGRW